MKKISLLATSALLTSSLYGAGFYVGAGIGSGTGTQTRDYSTGGSFETQYDVTSTTVKFGVITATNNRMELSINAITADRTGGNIFFQNTDDTESSEFTGFDLDYLITIGDNKMFAPYIGLGFGIYDNGDVHGVNTSTGTTETATGVALNAGVGVLYAPIENFELEAAYKYKTMSWNLSDPDMSEDMTQLYFGANFKF